MISGYIEAFAGFLDSQYLRSLTPEQRKELEKERAIERRHRELCRAIEKAGENARPRWYQL